MAKEPVLKTGARKRMWVRVPPPPLFPLLEGQGLTAVGLEGRRLVE